MFPLPRLRIFVDPTLAHQYGPELRWAWRSLLAGIGFAWEEVDRDSSDCDIAYVVDPASAPLARLRVRANPAVWRQRNELRLGGVGNGSDWYFPCYQGRSDPPPLVHSPTGRPVCERDLLFDFFWLVAGVEERHLPRDRHGFYELNESPYVSGGALKKALASGAAVGFQALLADLGQPDPLPRWPNGKRAAAGIGHDVDYPEVIPWIEPFRLLARQGTSGLRRLPGLLNGELHHWHFSDWLTLERHFGVRSAFYFVARCGSPLEYVLGTPDPFYDVQSARFQELFCQLRDAGCEIGLHASYRSFECPNMLAAERDALESASGGGVVGNRHHYWHLRPDAPEETLLMHERAELVYDASLFHDRYLGWRRGVCWPFYPFHHAKHRELRTLQLPTAWMDDQLFGQRAYNPGSRVELIAELLNTVVAQGGCFIADIHEYVFDDQLFPGWAHVYRQLLTHLASRGDIWIATPQHIAEHWIARQEQIAGASIGLGI